MEGIAEEVGGDVVVVVVQVVEVVSMVVGQERGEKVAFTHGMVEEKDGVEEEDKEEEVEGKDAVVEVVKGQKFRIEIERVSEEDKDEFVMNSCCCTLRV